jgi:hypothetical protein
MYNLTGYASYGQNPGAQLSILSVWNYSSLSSLTDNSVDELNAADYLLGRNNQEPATFRVAYQCPCVWLLFVMGTTVSFAYRQR